MKKYFSLLALIIILYACASVSSPTGGKKDDRSPELIESKPVDQKTNFTGKEISLLFDEWIKVENLNKELIITPRINNPFEFEQRKEKLTITFENEFDDSTTYTLNFRKSIKDITEGNVWEKPRISFSTGNYLDSIKVQGKIVDHLTLSPSKEILVGLYDANIDTANLRQGEPLYFATSNDKGYYQLTNIKAGNYLLYTFQDKNDNLINESSTENFGFYADTLRLFNISDTTVNLTSYHENQDTLKIKKSSPAGKDFKIDFNKGLLTYSIRRLESDSSQMLYTTTENSRSTIRIYKENFSI
ncbi:MAG: Ig-like domain-containing domain, partial [Nitrososphaeraceae archaeon]|nr:Ig-like domain-containing domain [Nitrososphaeraceae archaeon]